MMVKILIPHNRAIELLEARIRDVNNPSTDLNALKTRIQADVQAIFGLGSPQSFAVIPMNTLHFDDPVKLSKIKTNFRQTLQGFIDYIKDFQLIREEQVQISEEEYKKKFEDLAKEWNALVPEYNKLLSNYEDLHKDYDIALSKISTLENEISQTSSLTENIKILFLSASPINEAKLRVDQELRDIEVRLKMASLRESFDLKSEWAVTADILQQAMLDESPNIVHFSGHGDIDGIALEDSIGNSRLIDNDAIGSLFELFSEKVQCVFLNSCYSESQAKEISKYIPYVIGMKSSVPDDAAIAFSTGFYSALGAGKDFKFAFKMGILNIKLQGVTGSDIPVMLS